MAEEEELIPDEFVNNEYDMVAEPGEHLGLCVIFNSCTFDANCLPTRKGSEKDVKSITAVFGDCFGFQVVERKDQTKEQMESYLKETASSFKPAWRCFVCFFLSHGLGEEYLADSKGVRVNVRYLVRLFDGEQCPKMIGKPKLFFAQMCRGFDRKEYERSNRRYDATGTELVPETFPANISPDRDRLVCYATTPGRMAPMDSEKGSLFIQTLTKVLKQLSGKKTIEEVLSVVILMIDKTADDRYKVCPVFDSTLVGRLVFNPRPQNHHDIPPVATQEVLHEFLSDSVFESVICPEHDIPRVATQEVLQEFLSNSVFESVICPEHDIPRVATQEVLHEFLSDSVFESVICPEHDIRRVATQEVLHEFFSDSVFESVICPEHDIPRVATQEVMHELLSDSGFESVICPETNLPRDTTPETVNDREEGVLSETLKMARFFTAE